MMGFVFFEACAERLASKLELLFSCVIVLSPIFELFSLITLLAFDSFELL